jgi:hypothetical protein
VICWKWSCEKIREIMGQWKKPPVSFPIGLHVRLSLQAHEHGNGKKCLQTCN